MNPKDCVWEIQYRIIIEDNIAGKGGQITAALQFGSQIYSYAPSHENSRSKSSGGQGMRKNGEKFGVEPDESQKQERGD